jgi:hypothetical protein
VTNEDTEVYRLIKDAVAKVSIPSVTLSTEPGVCCSFTLVYDLQNGAVGRKELGTLMFSRAAKKGTAEMEKRIRWVLKQTWPMVEQE